MDGDGRWIDRRGFLAAAAGVVATGGVAGATDQEFDHLFGSELTDFEKRFGVHLLRSQAAVATLHGWTVAHILIDRYKTPNFRPNPRLVSASVWSSPHAGYTMVNGFAVDLDREDKVIASRNIDGKMGLTIDYMPGSPFDYRGARVRYSKGHDIQPPALPVSVSNLHITDFGCVAASFDVGFYFFGWDLWDCVCCGEELHCKPSGQ